MAVLWDETEETGQDAETFDKPLVVAVSRQIRNRCLRSMGIVPAASYQIDKIGPGDVVRIKFVQQEPFKVEVVNGTIDGVADHGHYKDVHILVEDESPKLVRVFESGPEDYGVVEFRILEKHWFPLQPNCGRI